MYWNDFIRVIREDLNTDGVEIIDETSSTDILSRPMQLIYAFGAMR